MELEEKVDKAMKISAKPLADPAAIKGRHFTPIPRRP
jgi:hypothetical protein